MTREDRVEIAKKTRKITKQGFYFTSDGKRVELRPKGPRTLYAVDFYSPEKLQAIVNDKEFFAKTFPEEEDPIFLLTDTDSFTGALATSDTASCLVLNFANAHHPGGGFLHGSKAQEEELCRRSTLYASISSKKAAAMYDYNWMRTLTDIEGQDVACYVVTLHEDGKQMATTPLNFHPFPNQPTLSNIVMLQGGKAKEEKKVLFTDKLIYDEDHKAIMDEAGKTLDEVIMMDSDEQNDFIHDHLNPYIVGDDSYLSHIADDLIDMIKGWEVGQREEDLDIPQETLDFLNGFPEYDGLEDTDEKDNVPS